MEPHRVKPPHDPVKSPVVTKGLRTCKGSSEPHRRRRSAAALTGSAAPDPRAALDAQPIVFRADAVPAVAGGAATACGIHRCAQFLLQTTDHLLVDLFPVVDLSTGVVLSADATEQP